MPQMAPIWWGTLFIMFIMSMIFTMMILYTSNPHTKTSTQKQMNTMNNSFNWTW